MNQQEQNEVRALYYFWENSLNNRTQEASSVDAWEAVANTNPDNVSQGDLVKKARRLLAEVTPEEYGLAYAQGYQVAIQDLLGDVVLEEATPTGATFSKGEHQPPAKYPTRGEK